MTINKENELYNLSSPLSLLVIIVYELFIVVAISLFGCAIRYFKLIGYRELKKPSKGFRHLIGYRELGPFLAQLCGFTRQ